MQPILLSISAVPSRASVRSPLMKDEDIAKLST